MPIRSSLQSPYLNLVRVSQTETPVLLKNRASNLVFQRQASFTYMAYTYMILIDLELYND